MSTIPPTLPFHIARAYGVHGAAPARSASQPAPAGRGEATSATLPFRAPEVQAPPRAGVLKPAAKAMVAAKVQGSVRFDSPAASKSASGAYPMYRHPADRNSAATGVEAGRVVDVEG